MLIIIILVAVLFFFVKGGAAVSTQVQVAKQNAAPPTSNKVDGVIGGLAQVGFQVALQSLRRGDDDTYPSEDQSGEDYSDIADGSTDTL